MTKRQALEEIKKILDDYVKKSDKIIRNAKQSGIWLMGLDSNNGLFKQLQKECNEKIKQIVSMVDKD
ncbi:MAG: hypothetical protein J6K62_01405 [Clostridia bacterium]|nr:hypothetical protein [Clostridia bacterium]